MSWRGLLGRWRIWVTLVGVAVLAGVLALVAFTGGSGGSADRAITHAYLQAAYAYERAMAANAVAGQAAVQRFASRLGRECGGVMARAPKDEESGSSIFSARRLGESRLHDEQRSDLEEELGTAVRMTFAGPSRQAADKYAATVDSLRWSDARLTRAVHEYAARLRETLDRPVPPVCANMKAWVASGYKTLPASTKALSQREARQASASRPRTPVASVSSALTRYEGPREKALVAQSRELANRQDSENKSGERIYERLVKTLGLTVHERRQESAEAGGPGSVVIARASTAAGEAFVARLGPKEHGSRTNGSGCGLPLSIKGPGMGGFSTCMSRSGASREPSVDCASARLTVTTNTLPATRSVRLRLSDGSQITSPVLFVPAHLGGPAGFYYQVVRGPSPIPVSLTELDTNHKAIRTTILPRIVECTSNPVKYLPGGIRTLVRDRVPDGPAFSIIGERYRFLGKVYFELKANVEETSEPGSAAIGGSSVTFGANKPSMLDWQTETGCDPHPYVILYSLLSAPADTVLLGTKGKLSAAHRVTIPTSLHAGGILIYAALPAGPSELVIRSPNGKTLSTEKLDQLTTETTETCQGEKEQRPIQR